MAADEPELKDILLQAFESYTQSSATFTIGWHFHIGEAPRICVDHDITHAEAAPTPFP